MPSPEPLMRIGDKGIVLRYSRCTMLAHIPYSDTGIPSNQAAVRNTHYPAFQNADYELMHARNENRVPNIRVQPHQWEVLCSYT